MFNEIGKFLYLRTKLKSKQYDFKLRYYSYAYPITPTVPYNMTTPGIDRADSKIKYVLADKKITEQLAVAEKPAASSRTLQIINLKKNQEKKI